MKGLKLFLPVGVLLAAALMVFSPSGPVRALSCAPPPEKTPLEHMRESEGVFVGRVTGTVGGPSLGYDQETYHTVEVTEQVKGPEAGEKVKVYVDPVWGSAQLFGTYLFVLDTQEGDKYDGNAYIEKLCSYQGIISEDSESFAVYQKEFNAVKGEDRALVYVLMGVSTAVLAAFTLLNSRKI